MANDNKNLPKVRDTGSMFLDAAFEALEQEKKDNDSFSYLLLTTDGHKMWSMGDGIEKDIIASVASGMKKDSALQKIILNAVALRIEDNPNVKNELTNIYNRIVKIKDN